MADLTPFEERDVIRTTVSIRNTGDGLSDALAVDPAEYHVKDRLYVVLECDVEKIRFEPVPKTDAMTRVHMLKAGNAAIVDGTLVADALRLQAERIAKAKEQAEGTQRIVFSDDEVEAFRMAHAEGDHDEGPIYGCPLCEGVEDATIVEEPASIESIKKRRGR